MSKRSATITPLVVVFVLFLIVVLPPFLPFAMATNRQLTAISIDSPYTTRVNVYKGQLHAHSTNSEGCNSPRDVALIYKDLGFNFTAITDHDYLTPDPEVPGILYIPGVEESTEPNGWHILSIGATNQVTQTEPQSIIDAINAQGATAIIAHPSWSRITQADLQALTGYAAVEIDDEPLWDGLLNANRRVFGVASDDSTCQSSFSRDYGRGWVQVFADSLDQNEILESLRSGNFYASTGPMLSVSVSGTVITAVTDSTSEIDWIGSEGTMLQSNSNAISGSYSATGGESYVRIRIIRNSDSTKAWSNALWISANGTTPTTTIAPLTSETSIAIMNFHMYSVVYKSSDSIHIYNGADINPPAQASPVTASVSCGLSTSEVSQFLPLDAQSLLAGSKAWIGMVAWITQPLAHDMTIRGTVNMTVWMNTPQPEVGRSAYALGIAESDGRARLVGQPVYEYRAGDGSILETSPQAYQLALSVDHTFPKGNLIAFVVAVAATTQGWRYQVYFDSPSMNSHVTLPVVVEVPVDEFVQTPSVITMSVVVLLFIALRQSRTRRTTKLSGSTQGQCSGRAVSNYPFLV